MFSRLSPLVVSLVTAAVSVTLGADVRAGGFELPGQGTFSLGRGAAFSVRADDPTAAIVNPGGLTRLTGTHLLVNHVLMWENATFTRQQTDLPQGFPYAGTTPNAPVENEDDLFAIGGMLILTSDFGTEDWTFAAGVWGPHAHGTKSYPAQGGQRYLLTEMSTILLFPSISAAYGEDDHWGFGITLQYALVPKLKLALAVDASPAPAELSAYYSQNDVIANIDVSENASFSAIIGGWWRPIPALEFGLSGRVIPVKLRLEGDINLSNVPGQSNFAAEKLAIEGSAARLDLTMPPTARFGARYRHLDGDREVFDLELNLVYEAWSIVDAYDIEIDGEIQFFTKDGKGVDALDEVVQKRWQDTFSVRLGGTVSAFRDDDMELLLSLGGYYESGAVPENYEHLDFLSFNRFGIGAGVAFDIGPVRISAAYQRVFQENRTVDERTGKVYQLRPLGHCPEGCTDPTPPAGATGWDGVPSNAGTFESSFDLLATGIEATF